MVQPKYSPEEALHRIKLMMEYDSSKTLTENKKLISEQDTLTKTAIGTGVGVAGGGAVGAGVAAAGANLAAGTAAGSAFALGSTLAPNIAGGAVAATALGGAVIAGAAALALTPLVIWYMDKDNVKPKVQRIIQYCSSDAQKIAKVERGVGDSEIRDLSDTLYDAMQGVGTDEEKVYGVFKSLKTASDFCALVNRFGKDYGDLLEWLDDDFDQSSEWEQIFRPIRNVVEDTLLTIKDDTVEEDCKKNPNQPKCKGGGGGGGYKSCSGTYSFGCKSNVIAKVQGCLGLVTDGKFGPKTKSALSSKGFTTFTDSDVDKICQKEETKLTSDVETQSLGGDQAGTSTSPSPDQESNTKTGIS